MTSPVRPPYLPFGIPLELLAIDETWAAVSVPADWGEHVLGVLGNRSGPAVIDPAFALIVWPLAAGGAADWPDATKAGVVRLGPGDTLLMPGLDGCHDGTRWLRSPAEPPAFTDPVVLRAAIEFVLGPLDQAGALGPLAVCRYCRTPTRDAVLVEQFYGASNSGYDWYACRPCWAKTLQGGEGRHLHAVREGPR